MVVNGQSRAPAFLPIMVDPQACSMRMERPQGCYMHVGEKEDWFPLSWNRTSHLVGTEIIDKIMRY
jgi:hypothetical protein